MHLYRYTYVLNVYVSSTEAVARTIRELTWCVRYIPGRSLARTYDDVNAQSAARARAQSASHTNTQCAALLQPRFCLSLQAPAAARSLLCGLTNRARVEAERETRIVALSAPYCATTHLSSTGRICSLVCAGSTLARVCVGMRIVTGKKVDCVIELARREGERLIGRFVGFRFPRRTRVAWRMEMQFRIVL